MGVQKNVKYTSASVLNKTPSKKFPEFPDSKQKSLFDIINEMKVLPVPPNPN
jgi:hypothetical protein